MSALLHGAILPILNLLFFWSKLVRDLTVPIFSQDMMFLLLNTVPINFWNLNQDFLHSPWDGSRLCEFGDRERLLFTQLFANPSDRPTRGPVDLLKPKTFRCPIFTNAGIWSAAVCDVWVRFPGATIFYFPGKACGKVVARWWQGGGCSFLPGCPICPTLSQVDWRTYTNSDTTRDQISAKEKLHWTIEDDMMNW